MRIRQAQSTPLSKATNVCTWIYISYICMYIHTHTHTMWKLSANNKHWKWYWLGGSISPPPSASALPPFCSSSTIYATQTRQTIIPIKRDWLCKQGSCLTPSLSLSLFRMLLLFRLLFRNSFSFTLVEPKFSINAIIRCPSRSSMERANFQSSPRRTFLQQ